MRFTLIDRVTELSLGERLVAVKNVSLAEEYLADHFPGFPVLPGVLMLEAMTQAGAWLTRASEDFAHSVVTLKEARNVKYANFVEPGSTLMVTAEFVAGGLTEGKREIQLKTQGTVGGQTAVSARLTLERYNLADSDASRSEADQLTRTKMRELFSLLYRGSSESKQAASDGERKNG